MFIITDQPQLVSTKLMEYTHHGVTKFDGQGCYMKENKTMLYTVVGADEVKDVIQLVRDLDSKVFINVMKSIGVTGNFYKEPIE